MTRQSLPKELPHFNGNPFEWPNFISQYRNSTTICGYSDVENQSRLQKCLRVKAAEIVRSLLIFPQNVNKVIETLERRFGRSEYIIFSLLDKLKKTPSVRDDKLDMLNIFSDEVNNLAFLAMSIYKIQFCCKN